MSMSSHPAPDCDLDKRSHFSGLLLGIMLYKDNLV